MRCMCAAGNHQDGLLLHTEDRTCGNVSTMLLKEGRLGLTPLGGRALRCLVSSLSRGLQLLPTTQLLLLGPGHFAAKADRTVTEGQSGEGAPSHSMGAQERLRQDIERRQT